MIIHVESLEKDFNPEQHKYFALGPQIIQSTNKYLLSVMYEEILLGTLKNTDIPLVQANNISHLARCLNT